LPVIALAILITIASPLYHVIKDPNSRKILLKKLGKKDNLTD
jgi:hypothetical protein